MYSGAVVRREHVARIFVSQFFFCITLFFLGSHSLSSRNRGLLLLKTARSFTRRVEAVISFGPLNNSFSTAYFSEADSDRNTLKFF